MQSLPKKSGVYVIETPTGKQYVGSSRRMYFRGHQHRGALRGCRHRNNRLQDAWNKYGEQLSIRPLLICAPKNLHFFEQRAMDVLKPILNIDPKVNPSRKWTPIERTKQAERSRGHKKSAETRARLSASLVGRKVSQETRAKISANHRGRKFGGAVSLPWLGKTLSAEHRAKMAAAKRGNKNRLGGTVSADARARISAKLKGMTRSPESIAKQRAAWAAKRAAS